MNNPTTSVTAQNPDVGAGSAATFAPRFFAVMLDSAIFFGVMLVVFTLLLLAVGKTNAKIIESLAYIFLFFFYYIWPVYMWGQTPGKMALKIKIVRQNAGDELSFLRTLYREAFGKWISSIVLGIGYLMVLFRSDSRALHDLIADTKVVKLK